MTEQTLVERVVRASMWVLVIAVLLVGLGTASLLHGSEVRSIDRAMFAAANAYGTHTWEPEHGHSPIQVHVATPGDPLLPPQTDDEDEGDERPVLYERDDLRVLVLTVESDEHHARIIVTSPAPTLVRTIGPFLAAYALVSFLVLFISSNVLHKALAAAVDPLRVARDDVERAMAGGQGQRVTPQGPREVHDLLTAIDDLMVRRDAAFAAQARFTAEAAHELRTPITSLLGGIDVALRRPRSAEELSETLRDTREDVARLADLVEGLLLLARVDAGHAEHARERVHSAEIAAEAARREEASIRDGGGTLAIDIEADGEVSVHRALVTAALANLLRNASVHARGTPVTLHVRRDGARLVYVVDDGGPGVAAEDREAMFDRLARGSTARPDRGGLGLGLPLAREIARRHGGDCGFVEASHGRVALWLPIAE